MIVHVKVNKTTNFQQLNPICVTVSSEKVLNSHNFKYRLIPHMLLGVTVNHARTQLMSINYDCTCESKQKYQF